MRKKYLASAASIIILLSACGGSSNQPSAPAASAASPGEAIYKKTCIACHQSNGEGLPNTFPPLAKSDFLSDKEKTILQVLKGYSGDLTVNGKKYNNTMPPQQLSDDEVAAVLSYVNSNFGNSGGAITADEVKAVRAKL